MNAVKHGLLAEELLITIGELTEDPEAFGQLLEGVRENYKPVGPFADALVQKIAGYLWKDRRAQRFETGAIQREVETPLGRKILAGEVRDGDVVRIGFDADRGALTFKTVEPLPEMPAFR